MYNPNFYKFRGNSTFQSNLQENFVPPPPVPPPFFIPPIPSTEKPDQEFVKRFENNIPDRPLKRDVVKPMSISEAREQLAEMLAALNDIKAKEKHLTENVGTLSDEEWSSQMKDIEGNKALINKTLAHIKGPYFDVLHKLLAKRSAKRLRMKRVRTENKRDKEEKRKELEERSRKIDENLQKIKDEIIKAQQEQEAKLEADMVLREVLRKKHDAKKCIVKLEALVKLRKARQNTAKGRGETVSESETAAFYASMDKLKSLWTQKLSSYETEEAQLRAKLKQDTVQLDSLTKVTEREVASNLDEWREALFGGTLPQVDFNGDVDEFLAVRSQWDQYISSEGTPLPIGWVPPSKQ
ncbi:uncharacterized protein LOC142979042 [Anticarsia gemmatalis]|uniref:uncharacterized protein LOC142979042 n=1 Tax=Anticarsia gemmatalis TaxID=129554 RepID=UPI003F75E66A